MWYVGHLFRSLSTEVIDTVRLFLEHTSYVYASSFKTKVPRFVKAT